MARTYLLVDFENVQPATLGAHVPATSDESFIKLFAGAQQSKVDLSLARALQEYGARAEYIQIVGSGKDALDFHIAYYIGQLAAQHPGASFIILSKDTGFDPLIRHLAQHGVDCTRISTVERKAPAKGGAAKAAAKVSARTPAKATPVAKKKASVANPSPAKTTASPTKATNPTTAESLLPAGRLDEIVRRLVGLKNARPGTLKTFRSSIMGWSKPPLSATQMDAVVEAMSSQGQIRIVGTKVVYALPPKLKP